LRETPLALRALPPNGGEKIFFAISFFAPSGGDAAKRKRGFKSRNNFSIDFYFVVFLLKNH
jgi:hypothetical protein